MALSTFVLLFAMWALLMRSSHVHSTDPPSKTFLKHTIAPVAICDDSIPVDPHKKVEECHTICNADPVNQGKARVTIYKDSSSSKKYKAVRCEKWKLSQTFTQTWLFSTVRSELVKEMLKPDTDECTKLIAEKCPDYSCDFHLPPSLPEEYYYASTNTITKNFVMLTTVPAIILHFDGNFHIQVAHEKDSFPTSTGVASTDKAVYRWSDSVSEGCPFDAGITLGCDKWKTDEAINYVCSNGRLAFESSGSKDLSQKCPPGTRLSSEGLIYREEKGEAAIKYDSQRIAMIADNKLSGDSETLRVLTSNGLAHLDSDLCSVGCEVAGLELRVARRQSTLIRTGAGYVMLSPKGHGYDCSKAVQCSMVKPYKFCGSPPRVNIMCDGKFYYWDPSKSFVILDNGCHSPTATEEFFIHLGNRKYSLDSDMSIELHENETDSTHIRAYTINKGSLINYEDLAEMKAEWTRSKMTPRSSFELETSKVLDQHSLFNTSIFAPLKKIGNWVSNSINNIERGIIAVVILVICVYLSKPIIKYLLASQRPAWNHYRRTPTERVGYDITII
uniref:G n=1 Tax=Lotus corniculatus virus 1 TaxID=2793731 RepID=A0A8D9UIP7_9RHAB|nr:TPA_asm: G [Lotus corniculatus virus 1]